MKRPINTYFGGKGGAGTYQTIINHIRPHDCYIEPYLGGGSIMLSKRPATINIGNDVDSEVIAVWKKNRLSWLNLFNRPALDLLQDFIDSDYFSQWERVCIYLDPPYPLSSRKRQQKVYRYEMTDEQHRQLLGIIRQLPAHVDVLISTYPNTLYAQMLEDWYLVKFYSQTRRGRALEYLYLNYPVVDQLHDTGYVGQDFRERGRIKKKVLRWQANFRKLPLGEQQAIFKALCQIPELQQVQMTIGPDAVHSSDPTSSPAALVATAAGSPRASPPVAIRTGTDSKEVVEPQLSLSF